MNYQDKTREELINELQELREEYDSFKELSEKRSLQSQLIENELKKSQSFLNETGKMVKVGGWEIDVETKEVLWTDEVYRIHEMDLSYKPTLNQGIGFFTMELKPVIERAIQRAMEFGEPFDLDLEIITSMGNSRWVHVLGKANYLNEKIVNVTGTFQEITDRKRIENELAREKYLFTSLMDNLPESIYYKDRECRYTRINKSCAFVNGFSDPQQAIGKSNFDLYPEEIALKVYNDEQKILHTGQPINLEEKLILENQSDIWFSTIKMPLHDNEGDITGLFGISRDITERKRNEEQLLLHANALKSISECVSITDVSGKVLFLNQSFLKTYGYEENELMGKNIGIVGSPDNSPEIVSGILPATILGGWHGELLNRRKDGSEFPVYIATSAVYDDNQEPVAIIRVANDITRRKASEAKIKQMNEVLQIVNAEKDKFFSILAHDLRGPLSAFVAATQILIEEIQTMDKEDIRDITVSMKTSATNIYSLLENLLEWSRLMQGRMDFVPDKFNLKKKIETCIDVLSEYARKKRIDILVSVNDAMTISADNHMFETLIRNLVSNAIKFTPVGGKVKVEADNESDGSIEIRIIDSGIGMGQELIGKLFSLTEKTNRNGTEGEPSTGLGLLLCKEFVEKHGGKIWVESEVGKGSTFCFSLPT
jgi:PAS domain S-box-containing protein